MAVIGFRDQISRNKRNSIFLICSVALIIIVLGYVIGRGFGPEYFTMIMIVAIIFSLGYTLVVYYNSDSIALRAVGAKEAKREEYPDYHRLVDGLIIAAGIPKPKLYVMASSQINAFASGRDPAHAVVCVTRGALEKLERRELENVLAHELGHIANYDIRFVTLVTVMVGMVAIISQIFLRSFWFGGRRDSGGRSEGLFMIIGIVLAILAPIVVTLVQLAISRRREFLADATAVQFTRNPQGLISALEKIRNDYVADKPKVSKALSPMFFVAPLKAWGSTHPPIEARIKALERM